MAILGLQPSLAKGIVFSAGVSLEMKVQLRQILVKYLGVPLINSRLKHSDCLVQKKKVWLRCSPGLISSSPMGVRSQLIASVLFGIQVYRNSTFILPKKVLKDTESVLRDFLRKGIGLCSSGAKIDWRSVCTPKN